MRTERNASANLVVTAVIFRSANSADQAAGVLGFVRATINGLVIDGLTIRRGLTGDPHLGFPKHRDRHGNIHAVVRPADDAVRREITRQILAALSLEATATSPATAQGQSR